MITSFEKEKAYIAAGWRERYAMEHGTPKIIYIRGNRCIKWSYPPTEEYQDANGAIFDTVRRVWIA